jgi:hypothetical protein
MVRSTEGDAAKPEVSNLRPAGRMQAADILRAAGNTFSKQAVTGGISDNCSQSREDKGKVSTYGPRFYPVK